MRYYVFIGEVVGIYWEGVEVVRFLCMGLSVLEVMVDLEDVKKGVLEEESSVLELWEMVDLEENMKKLLVFFEIVFF